ncbi:gene transfer agent family protein [Leisingera daeponensis]|uniref:Gene transfer agent family protein n=1 Tax=Leisingera daeponensis TaxID=405746 RepID=A0ABS7NBE8_9RHOB|nr:GTA-gp10 family protein [Leisingera daeponensis]MBY6138526.1 gene transfer agent family protein [Leisingera daeponensis]
MAIAKVGERDGGAAVAAPRGGLAEKLGQTRHALLLGNGEIERFEDLHRGIFDLHDGFFGRAQKPTAREVRDLVALGLVGNGMEAEKADALVSALGPEHNPHLYQVAQGLVGIAFYPDMAGPGGGEDPGGDDAGTSEKKTRPAPGA